MHRYGRSTLIGLTALVLGLTPATASLAQSSASNTTTIDHKTAEADLFKVFPLPSGFTLQNDNLNTQARPSQWFLNFQKKSGGYIGAQVNAVTGTILSYNYGSPGTNSSSTTPIGKTKALALAQTFLQKAHPNRYHEMKLVSVPSQQGMYKPPIYVKQPTRYTFSWERTVNGIPYPANGASMVISGSGNVVSYQFHWSHGLTFPSATPTTSLSQAQATLQSQLPLRLTYRMYYSPQAGKATPQVVLSYQLANQAQNYGGLGYNNLGFSWQLMQPPFVDAQSGSLLSGSGKAYTASTAPTPIVPNGPTHWPQLLSTSLTESQSKALASKMVPNLSQDTYQGASENSYTDPQGVQHKTWVFNWRTANKHNLSVTVNPLYGIVTGYNHFIQYAHNMMNSQMGSQATSSTQTTTAVSKGLSTSAREAIAVKFLQQVLPNTVGALYLQSNSQGIVNPNAPESYFNFYNMVNGIPNHLSNISISVNSKGQVTNYYIGGLTQQNNLPSTSGVISKTQAVSDWLQGRTLSLMYVPFYPPSNGKQIQNIQPTVRLVYALSPAQGHMLNAKTGSFMQVLHPSAIQPKDLKGVWAAKAIESLIGAGLWNLGPHGNAHPYHVLSRGHAISILVKAFGAYFVYPLHNQASLTGVSKSKYQKEIQMAASRGWINATGNFNPTAPLTRQTLARWVTNMLGDATLAADTSLFHLSYTDTSSISSSYVGDVAVVTGFHLLTGIQNRFDPTGSVDLAQLATVIHRLLPYQSHINRMTKVVN